MTHVHEFEASEWALLSQGRSSAVFAYTGANSHFVRVRIEMTLLSVSTSGKSGLFIQASHVLRVRKCRKAEFVEDPATAALERELWPELPLDGAGTPFLEHLKTG